MNPSTTLSDFSLNLSRCPYNFIIISMSLSYFFNFFSSFFLAFLDAESIAPFSRSDSSFFEHCFCASSSFWCFAAIFY